MVLIRKEEIIWMKVWISLEIEEDGNNREKNN